jgi:hypothetical protein
MQKKKKKGQAGVKADIRSCWESDQELDLP